MDVQNDRLQADALEIEARAKRRLADEYDAAQERGEVAKAGWNGNQYTRKWVVEGEHHPVKPTLKELSLDKTTIKESRKIRDAEIADPGIVRRVLDEELKAGRAPTRERLKQETGGRAAVAATAETPNPNLQPRCGGSS